MLGKTLNRRCIASKEHGQVRGLTSRSGETPGHTTQPRDRVNTMLIPWASCIPGVKGQEGHLTLCCPSPDPSAHFQGGNVRPAQTGHSTGNLTTQDRRRGTHRDAEETRQVAAWGALSVVLEQRGGGDGELTATHLAWVLIIINCVWEALFPGCSMVKNLPANAGDAGSITGLGRFPWRRR